MKSSDNINDLAAALAAAQGEYEPIKKTREVKIPTKKGIITYSYAPLDACLAMIKPIFAKHGLCLLQSMQGNDVLLTRVVHTSGQWIEGETPILLKPAPTEAWAIAAWNPMKELGGAITYASRYGLRLINVVTEEDTDHNLGETEAQPPPQQPKPINVDKLEADLLAAARAGKEAFAARWRSLSKLERKQISARAIKTYKDECAIADTPKPDEPKPNEPKPNEPKQKSSDHITENQRRMLEARISKDNMTRDDAKKIVLELTGAEHFADILKADFQDVLEALFGEEEKSS